MAVLCRWILVSTLLLAAGPRLWAASAADRAFDAARKALDDTFYARAEAQFADFSQKFPASPRVPEAILCQAEARIKLTNYAGAIALLTANQSKAGTNADEYLFWLGEAYSGKGDWAAASNAFAGLVKEYPASSRCLEASIKEAQALSALAQKEPAEWQRVIGLLAQTNGVFQSAARTNAASEWVPPGYLLLSEAQLATKDYHGAELTLQPLAKRLLSPKLTWQWRYLLCRIQLADGRTNAALVTSTNLLATATSAGQSNLLAETAAFQATLLEGLGRTNDAIVAYKRNLAEGVPDARQRQALLKIAELYLAQGETREAAHTLEQFLTRYPKAASADLAWLTLGELRLRLPPGTTTNGVAPAATNAPPATNNLQLASAAFSMLVTNFPHSPLVGKAQLDLGWCYRQGGRLAESQAAYQAAVERLPFSADLATAHFRLADVEMQQSNFRGALTNYQIIKEKFAALPEVRTNLFGRALYQTVRAGVEGGDLAAATNALEQVRAMYPRSLDTARAVLLTGQAVSRGGNPAEARQMFQDFIHTVPDTSLLPELQLAIAVTYEQEDKWREAITQYDAWLASFPTNNVDRPRAEYYRALDMSFEPGQETNALACFTNLMARFPTSEFAPWARLWVADYYYRIGDPLQAELNYRLLSQDTNWPSANRYEAQLMAGRAAVRHQAWGPAKSYFTNLYNNLAVTNDLRLQALFEYGQTLMAHSDPTETNKLANNEEATRVFGRIWNEYPTNPVAVQALAAKADCYMQWALAKQQYDALTNALNAYEQVLASPQADVTARSSAKVGIAIVLQKWAEHKPAREQTALLERALSNCVDVVYGKILRDDEHLDAFWTQKAAEKAFELAETLQAWSKAANLYMRLTNSIWPLPDPTIQRRAAAAFEQLRREQESR